MTSARTMYMTPMRLWSVDVMYSFHRYGHQPLRQTHIASAAITSRITSEVISGIGWLDGIGSHVRLPTICFAHRRLRRNGHARRRGSRGNRRGQPVRHYGIEQPRRDRTIGHGLHIAARFLELRVAGRVELRPGSTRALGPHGELVGRQSLDLELHAWEAVATEMRRLPLIDALPVCLEVQARRHPRHGVD